MTSQQSKTTEVSRFEELHRVTRHNAILVSLLGLALLFLGHNLPLNQGWATKVAAGMVLLLGFIFYMPLDNLRRVVNDNADDINLVIAAADNLRSAFSVAQAILVFLIAIILMEISLLLF
jgi:cytochrome c biogenesis protein CcdA